MNSTSGEKVNGQETLKESGRPAKDEAHETAGFKEMAHGINYRIKLLMLILHRACAANLQFKLATEMKDADKFGNIVLEYQSEDGRKEAIFINCSHKDNTNSNIKDKDLKSNKGQFSLQKHFESYKKLASKTGKFHDNFIKYLILFTNGNIGEKVKKDIGMEMVKVDEKIMKILTQNSTDKQQQCYYQLRKTSSIMNSTKWKGSAMELEGFQKKFLLAINQSSLNDLEKIIADEMAAGLRVMDREQNVAKINQYIKEWMEDKTGTYITKENGDAFFEKLKNEIKQITGMIFENPEKKLKFGDFFKETETNILKSKVCLPGQTILHIKSASPSLTLIKTVQTLQNNDNFVALNVTTLISLANEIADTFHEKLCVTLVVECGLLNNEEIAKAKEVMSKLLDKSTCTKMGNKTVILVSHKNNNYIATLTGEEIPESIEDASNYKDMTESAQRRILDYTVSFQGFSIALKEMVNDGATQLLNEELVNKIVEKDPICIGEALRPSNEMESYYITRKLKMKPNANTNDNNKVGVIEGGPGIGKSTELARMALDMKTNNKKMFVIQLNLLDCSHQLDELKLTEENAILDFLAKSGGKTETDLEKDLLKQYLLHTDQVALFVDGFSEISDACAEKVIQMLKFAKYETKVKTIWVTTRPQPRNSLEKELDPAFYYLERFDEIEQKEFFNKYWISELKPMADITFVSKYAEKLVTLLNYTEYKTMSELIGIPLQTRMIAEVYEKNCTEFCNANGAIQNVIEKINISELFEEFFKKKLDVYFSEKAKMDLNNTFANKTKARVSKRYREQIQRMALRSLLPDYGNVFFKEKSNDHVDLVNLGLLQYSNENLEFIHRSFAEYFVADFLVENWQNVTTDSNLMRVLRCIRSHESNKSIHQFLDTMLEENKTSIVV